MRHNSLFEPLATVCEVHGWAHARNQKLSCFLGNAIITPLAPTSDRLINTRSVMIQGIDEAMAK